MKLTITGITGDRYKGAYARIFKILNRGSIFVEPYWEEDHTLENGVMILEINEEPTDDQLQEILKIKNVTI